MTGVRFPKMLRIRHDKPHEANTRQDLEALLKQ
jgi:hypothetical protein